MRILAQKLTTCPRCTIATVSACFVALIVTLFLVDLRSRYDMAIDRAKQSALNYAEVLAEHTASVFEAVDRSLREVEFIRMNTKARAAEDAAGASPGGGAGAAAMPRPPTANEALRHLQQTSPLLVSISWTDAVGNIEAYSHPAGVAMPNLSAFPIFTAPRDGSQGLYVEPPFRWSVDGRRLMGVSRRLENPDGSFAGIVGAVIDQSYFSTIYKSIHLGDNGAVLVVKRDGRAIVREPAVEDLFTRNYGHGPLLTEYLPRAEADAYEGVSTVDGVSRIIGYRAVKGLPLILVVSYERADVLAPWYHHLYTAGPLTAFVVLVFGVGAGVLMWQTRKLARKSDILEVTLENMTHGLCMFDGSQRLTVCNRRYVEMYGLAPGHATPGTTLRSILEARVEAGQSPKAAQEYIDSRMEEVAHNEPYYVVNELRDGRVVSVTHQPISGGGWVGIHQDITDKRRDEERVAYMAHHDLLTGIANRAYFMQRLEEAGARLRRHHEPFTVFMLDLDRFKNVNDSLGHPAGDALLQETARRLKSVLREVDALARLGGDEFAIIQSGGDNQEDAAIAAANRIIDALTEPYNINNHVVNVGTSIGIAVAPADGIDPDTLMKKADLALYRTKSEGRNGYRFFDQRMTADADARRQMETELRAALAASELDVHYQPIIDVKTQKLFGLEALVRWHHPTRGDISPAEFIPLAEETGLIHALGEWVLLTACTEAATWPAHVKLSVNLSPVQFRKSNLLDIILCVLVDSALAPERLELEITETTLLEQEAEHLAVMRQLKNLGVSISLDDFGTGYSSLSYLTMFPFDKIKIDRSFTRNLTQRADCAAIVSSVLALAAGLDLKTVAEGVETEQQFEILRASGVQYAQGFLFGRARPANEIDFERTWTERLENVA
jgi:diguanylate cyclase (GGDEF)-like protein